MSIQTGSTIVGYFAFVGQGRLHIVSGVTIALGAIITLPSLWCGHGAYQDYRKTLNS